MNDTVRVAVLGEDRIGVTRFLAEAGHVVLGESRAGGPGPDVVVTCGSLPRAALRGKPAGVPVGSIAYELPARRRDRSALRRADAVVAVHEVVRRDLVEAGVAEDRITTIRTPVAPTVVGDDPIALRNTLTWREGEIVAVCPGPVEAAFDLGTMVDAARAAEDLGVPVRFVVLSDSSSYAFLRHVGRGISTLQVLDRGGQDALAAVIAAADVLVHTERRVPEPPGAPLTVAPYLAAGRPIVVAALPESAAAIDVEDSGGGLQVPRGDARMVLEAVLQLGVDREQAATLGLRGQLFARDTLSVSAVRSAYLAWVERLAVRRPSLPAQRSGAASDVPTPGRRADAT